MNQDETMPILAEQLREHHPAALEHLYDYAPRLERALQWRFGAVIAREDLQDIVSDTLIRAWQTGERFDPHAATLATWLTTLAHYEALSFLRTHTNLIDPTARAALVEQCVAELDQHVEDQGPSAQMAQLLEALPAQQAVMLRQHYYEGYPYDEIARLHQVREVTVKSQLSRARSTLRTRLQERMMA